MIKYLVFHIILISLISCKSDVKVELNDSGSLGSNSNSKVVNPADILNLKTIGITSPDFSKDVYISIPFTGDLNNDSVVTMYFCSLKLQAGCDPTSGESIVLTKSGANVSGSISIGSSSFTPGDFLKFKISISDSDGFDLEQESGYILIPYDGSVPRTIRQLGRYTFGTNQVSALGSDYIKDIVKAQDGSIYLAGYTYSHLGEPNAGSSDIVIIKLKPNGELDLSFGIKGYWHFGLVSSSYSNKADNVSSIKLDGEGNLYIVGDTYSALGGANAGQSDGFVIKISASTGIIDSQFGDGDGRDNDGVLQVNAVNTADATGFDYVKSITLDSSGNLYICGTTDGPLGGANSNNDGFIIKASALSGVLDSSFGNGDGADNDGIVQVNSTNTPDASGWDFLDSIVIDSSNNLYVGGYGSSPLGGPLSGGAYGGNIIKLSAITGIFDGDFGDGDGTDNDGVLQINDTNTANATGNDYIRKIQLDGLGNLFIAGNTDSSMGGLKAGERDAFILKVNATTGIFDSDFGDGDGADNDGVMQINATNSAAAGSSEYVTAMTLDGNGNAFLFGHTTSSLSSANAGEQDGFIIKLNSISGALDANFGDGDGNDNDGIIHLNTSNTADAILSDQLYAGIDDGAGNIYAVGSTKSSLGGVNAGGFDSFIVKLDSASGVLSTSFGDGDGADNDGVKQFNNQSNKAYPNANEHVSSIAHDGAGNIYLAGQTWSSFGGVHGGLFQNGFIVKMNATTGELDSDFGDGDGTDNDGIVQFTTVNTPNIDSGAGIDAMVLDGLGNIFVTSETYDDLGGPNASLQDGFVIKLDANSGAFDTSFGDGDGVDNDGILQINHINTAGSAGTRQYLSAIAVDGIGNVFVAGESWGGLGGPLSGAFKQDMVIIKFDANSGVLDTAFGDNDGVNNDGIVQVNNVYATNGSTVDKAYDLKVDGLGSVFVLGTSWGAALGGPESTGGALDGILLKLNATTGVRDAVFGDGDGADNDGIVRINNNNANGRGTLQRMELDGAGNIFVTGNTTESLGGANAGNADVFVVKLDASSGDFDANFGDGDGTDDDGILQINNSNATDASGNDLVTSIKLDGSGNLLMTGYTYGALGGPITVSSLADIFIIKLNQSSGVLDANFGDADGTDDDGILHINNNNAANASGNDLSKAMAIDGTGNIFIGGNTSGSLGAGNASTASDDAISIMIPAGADGI